MLERHTTHAIWQFKLTTTNQWSTEDFITSGGVPIPQDVIYTYKLITVSWEKFSLYKMRWLPAIIQQKKKTCALCCSTRRTIKTNTRTSLYFKVVHYQPLVTALLPLCDKTLCHSSTYLNVIPIIKLKGNGLVLLMSFWCLCLGVYCQRVLFFSFFFFLPIFQMGGECLELLRREREKDLFRASQEGCA